MRYIEYTLDFFKNYPNNKIATMGLEEFPYFDFKDENTKYKKNNFLSSYNIFDKELLVIDSDNILEILPQLMNINLKDYTLFLSRVSEHFRNSELIFKGLSQIFKEIVHIVPDMYTIYKNLKNHNNQINTDYIDFKHVFFNYDLYGGDSHINHYHGLYFSKNVINNIYSKIFKLTDVESITIDNVPHIKFISTGNQKNKVDSKMFNSDKYFLNEYNTLKIIVSDSYISYPIQIKDNDVDNLIDNIVSKNYHKHLHIYNMLSLLKFTDIHYYLWKLCNSISVDSHIQLTELNIDPIIECYFEKVTKLEEYYTLCSYMFGNIIYSTNDKINYIKKSYLNADILTKFVLQENLYSFNQIQYSTDINNQNLIKIGLYIKD